MDSSTNQTLPSNVDDKSARILPLVLKNVSYEKAGMRLIKDLSVTFNFGSLTVILGPNGAGKSLLLRLCHGLIKPSKGTVDWCGPKVSVPSVIKQWYSSDRLCLGVALLPILAIVSSIGELIRRSALKR